MNNTQIDYVEELLDYSFNNQALLDQAFTRSSYSNENGGENNEVLEFYGDTVIGLVTVNHLFNRYSIITKDGQYKSKKDPEGLTQDKQRYVSRPNLSKRMRDLKLAEFIKAGEGDDKTNATFEDSVLEDTFEALVGALYIDSNRDIDLIEGQVSMLLGLDLNFNAILKEELKTLYKKVFNAEYPDKYVRCSVAEGEYKLTIPLTINNIVLSYMHFAGYTEEETLENVISMLKNMDKYGAVERIKTIKFDTESAINALQELEQKHVISNLDYIFESNETETAITWNAKAIWESPLIKKENRDDGITLLQLNAPTKKEAKKEAATSLLMKLLDIASIAYTLRTLDYRNPWYDHVNTEGDEDYASMIDFLKEKGEDLRSTSVMEFVLERKWDLDTITRVLDKCHNRY